MANTTHIHMFDCQDNVDNIIEILTNVSKHSLEPGYWIYHSLDEPHFHNEVQVTPYPASLQIALFDARLPEAVRMTALGEVLYARLQKLPANRTRVSLACCDESFLSLYEYVLSLFGELDCWRKALGLVAPSAEVVADSPIEKIAPVQVVKEGVQNSESTTVPSIHLTVRQSEVAELIAEGKTSNMISAELVIAQKTVESHRSAIRDAIKDAYGLPRLWPGQLSILLRRQGYGKEKMWVDLGCSRGHDSKISGTA